MHSMLTFDEIKDLSKIFNAEEWLKENFGCEFYPSNAGWLNTSCPFEDHQDSNPSFGINTEEGFYKCFGCGRQGNYVFLVSELTKLSFSQAINIVSEYAGVNLNALNTLQYKADRLKKVLEDENQEFYKRKKIIIKAIIAIKKIQKKDFDEGEALYQQLDKYVADQQYNKILEIINGRTN